MQRRAFLKQSAFGAAAVLLAGSGTAFAETADTGIEARLAHLEQRYGGRLGVAIRDTGSGRRAAWRGGERFLMCSTFKLLLVAATLARVDRGVERLDRRVVFGPGALLDYAPVSKRHVGPPGLSIAALCEAAITLSDNTAANLLLRSIGGPQAFTAYARRLGDGKTLLDHYEIALNPVDTTTPDSMAGDMQQVLLGGTLSLASRDQLTRWLLACQTGHQSLRAGLPGDWRVGDKTGQWDGDGTGANNDIAIVWPPRRKPLLVAAYYMNAAADPSGRKAVLAAVGRIVATM